MSMGPTGGVGPSTVGPRDGQRPRSGCAKLRDGAHQVSRRRAAIGRILSINEDECAEDGHPLPRPIPGAGAPERVTAGGSRNGSSHTLARGRHGGIRDGADRSPRAAWPRVVWPTIGSRGLRPRRSHRTGAGPTAGARSAVAMVRGAITGIEPMTIPDDRDRAEVNVGQAGRPQRARPRRRGAPACRWPAGRRVAPPWPGSAPGRRGQGEDFGGDLGRGTETPTWAYDGVALRG